MANHSIDVYCPHCHRLYDLRRYGDGAIVVPESERKRYDTFFANIRCQICGHIGLQKG